MTIYHKAIWIISSSYNYISLIIHKPFFLLPCRQITPKSLNFLICFSIALGFTPMRSLISEAVSEGFSSNVNNSCLSFIPNSLPNLTTNSFSISNNPTALFSSSYITQLLSLTNIFHHLAYSKAYIRGCH